MSSHRRADSSKTGVGALVSQQMGREFNEGTLIVTIAGTGFVLYSRKAKVGDVLARMEQSMSEQQMLRDTAATPEDLARAIENIESLESQIRRIEFGHELNPAD